MRLRLLAILCCLTAACGDSPTAPAAVPIEQTVFATSLGVNLAQSTKLPSGMYYRDITIGTGATLVSGRRVGMQYIGALADGTVFAPSAPYSFILGTGEVIPGWDLGIPGMKIGGRRQLIIPPDLAYGASGSPPVIPGNAVLVFTVDAVSTQ
jgi:peptidylprolyl isomerase